MPVQIELLKNDLLGLRFAYDSELVRRLRALSHRRWNPGESRWEVHLSHLPEIVKIFSLSRADLPQPLVRYFEERWKSKSVRVRLGSLEGSLSGPLLPLKEIDDATSFLTPGYRFSPRFQAGKWDGRRHLFRIRTMKFPSGLWPRIRAVLEQHKIECQIEGPAEPQSPALQCRAPATPLRPYQMAALEEALKSRRGIVQIATGGGKTLLAAHLIHHLGRRAFFFVHTLELLHQTAAVFERELGIEVGKLGDGRAEIRDLTVATIQTVARVFGLTLPRGAAEDGESTEPTPGENPAPLRERRAEIAEAIQNVGVVVFDECHHVPAETFYKIAFKTPRAHARFGLSATPWRDDGHDLLLEAALGPKICAITCTDLIQSGFLVPPQITMIRTPAPRINPRGLTYAEVYRLAIVENQSRNRAIAAQAQKWTEEGRNVLILVTQVAHGQALQKLLPDARFAHGSVSTELRRQYLVELERKLHPVLIATTLADEGLDLPALESLILAGGGKSDTKAYQRIGRALRPSPGKDKAFVMDFFDLPPFLKEHSLARLALYRQEPAFRVVSRGFSE